MNVLLQFDLFLLEVRREDVELGLSLVFLSLGFVTRVTERIHL